MSNPFEPRSPGGGAGMVVLRLGIAGLVAALAVALWVSGHVLIGGLVLALAVVRLVLFFTTRHRRQRWRQRWPPPPGRRGGRRGSTGCAAPSIPGAPVPHDPPH